MFNLDYNNFIKRVFGGSPTSPGIFAKRVNTALETYVFVSIYSIGAVLTFFENVKCH